MQPASWAITAAKTPEGCRITPGMSAASASFRAASAGTRRDILGRMLPARGWTRVRRVLFARDEARYARHVVREIFRHFARTGNAIRATVLRSVSQLLVAEPIIAEGVVSGTVQVVGAEYDLASGIVRVIT